MGHRSCHWHILCRYKKCLQQVCNDSLDEEPEDDRKSASGSNVQDILAPNFSDFITGLCRSASSSVPNSSYSEHSSWNKALLSITAAFCFELAVDPALPLDCKLIGFAISHFVDCIRRLDPQSTLGSTSSSDTTFFGGEASVEQQRDCENKYLLCKQLPKPIVPLKTEATKIAVSENQDEMDLASMCCNFAGLIAVESFTDEHAIALAIRAVQKHQGDSSHGAGKLLTFLTHLRKSNNYFHLPEELTCCVLESNPLCIDIEVVESIEKCLFLPAVRRSTNMLLLKLFLQLK